jgi:hypothetical protein
VVAHRQVVARQVAVGRQAPIESLDARSEGGLVLERDRDAEQRVDLRQVAQSGSEGVSSGGTAA